MLEHYFGLTTPMLAYLNVLAIMIAFYALEISSVMVRATTRWLVPAQSAKRRG